jgi:hypothetical protein
MAGGSLPVRGGSATLANSRHLPGPAGCGAGHLKPRSIKLARKLFVQVVDGNHRFENTMRRTCGDGIMALGQVSAEG